MSRPVFEKETNSIATKTLDHKKCEFGDVTAFQDLFQLIEEVLLSNRSVTDVNLSQKIFKKPMGWPVVAQGEPM